MAVLIVLGKAPKFLCYYLGPLTNHSMYKGELIGLVLGVELLHHEHACHTASCTANNMASLCAAQNCKPHPVHYLVDELLWRIEALQRRHPGINLTLRWVPGHKGIKGNEMVDVEAKKVARGDSSLVEDLPGWLQKQGTLPKSVSKVRQVLNTMIVCQVKEEGQYGWTR